MVPTSRFPPVLPCLSPVPPHQSPPHPSRPSHPSPTSHPTPPPQPSVCVCVWVFASASLRLRLCVCTAAAFAAHDCQWLAVVHMSRGMLFCSHPIPMLGNRRWNKFPNRTPDKHNSQVELVDFPPYPQNSMLCCLGQKRPPSQWKLKSNPAVAR